MEELYMTMKQKMHELYTTENGVVELDGIVFFKLYKLVCDMMQIKNLMGQYD